MARRLPEKIYPERLARRGARLQGSLAPADLARLRRLTSDTLGPVQVCLDFIQDDRGFIKVAGTLDTTASFDCQRCLEPLPMTLQVEVGIALVREGDEWARREAEEAGLDVIDVAGDIEAEQIGLAQFAEQELLLTVPDYPMHGDVVGGQCGLNNDYVTDAPAPDAARGESDDDGDDVVSDENATGGRSKPFAGLKELLDKSSQ
ncbi:MAG: hypothetical protein ACI8PT_004806 [Gammaproteobacteria bacterium]|jgi:uncharacterized protein